MINTKKRIAFFTHYTELYGANKSLINLVEGLLKAQLAEVMLVTPSEGKITRFARKNSIPYLVLPFYNEVQYGPRKGTDILKNIFKLLYNWLLVLRHSRKLDRFDIIHSNSSATLIGAYFAKWKQKPHIWHIREYGWEDYKFTYNFGYQYFQRWLNRSSAIIGISGSIYQHRIASSPVKTKAVIYNGVIFAGEIPPPSVGPETQDISDKVIFAVIGLIRKEKNQMEALRAFQQIYKTHNTTELWVIGDGDPEYIHTLKTFVSRNGLSECVKFTGFVDDITPVYKSLYCLLMCSANEALGRVTIEAMVNNVPVIGYNNAGTAEIIRDNYNGLLYSDGPTELSWKMELLLNDKGLVKKIKQNARLEIQKKFTIEKYSKTVYNVYTSILLSAH